jgi:hypothetical protein
MKNDNKHGLYILKTRRYFIIKVFQMARRILFEQYTPHITLKDPEHFQGPHSGPGNHRRPLYPSTCFIFLFYIGISVVRRGFVRLGAER